ncbi:hypothetical protein SRCM100623_02234 [Acetobacter pasteurianus]|uniref:Uncharacterized protein n=1 Tax=Acetobacter pasteurianus TaxID=438 RepID=A0A1A0D7B6_ACEPA|nr:hypothetical protein SRCM100623_02234 [Acetobacter pasteurianus]GCD51239.1 hypothetical protein NBRC106471_2795 [Acetobacter pasteurianus subsp. pasteurianus LMG 1262 = NBRC 106471]
MRIARNAIDDGILLISIIIGVFVVDIDGIYTIRINIDCSTFSPEVGENGTVLLQIDRPARNRNGAGCCAKRSIDQIDCAAVIDLVIIKNNVTLIVDNGQGTGLHIDTSQFNFCGCINNNAAVVFQARCSKNIAIAITVLILGGDFECAVLPDAQTAELIIVRRVCDHNVWCLITIIPNVDISILLTLRNGPSSPSRNVAGRNRVSFAVIKGPVGWIRPVSACGGARPTPVGIVLMITCALTYVLRCITTRRNCIRCSGRQGIMQVVVWVRWKCG